MWASKFNVGVNLSEASDYIGNGNQISSGSLLIPCQLLKPCISLFSCNQDTSDVSVFCKFLTQASFVFFFFFFNPGTLVLFLLPECPELGKIFNVYLLNEWINKVKQNFLPSNLRLFRAFIMQMYNLNF